MNKINEEKVKLSTKEILINLLDDSISIFKSGYKLYPSVYKDFSNIQKALRSKKFDYYNKLWKLEKQGYIKNFKDSKKNIIKLTPVGQKRAIKFAFENYHIKKPKYWDKKWRVIIFDIPEDKKNIRNAIRFKLKNCGFYQLQKSVWIHPFECKDLIWSIKYVYSVSAYIQYLLVETLESEIDLIGYFYENQILDKKTREDILWYK